MKMLTLTKTLFALTFFLFANFGTVGQSATLHAPTLNGDQFQFNLECVPDRAYVIQGSSDLQNWTSLATNVSPEATRTLSFAASNGFAFYRCAYVSYPRTNSFSKAIQTTETLDLNGYNLALDSFNSTDPGFSTDGQYDPSKRSDTAELSLDLGLINLLEPDLDPEVKPEAYAVILGSITIGPGAPLTIGSNGVVGDLAWVNGAQTGVQPGKLLTDVNPIFPQVTLPFTNGFSGMPAGGFVTNNVTNVQYFQHIFSSGDYRVTGLSGAILIAGNARVHVTGNLNLISAQNSITIATNASLKLYVGGSNTSFGSQGIKNKNSNATSFIYCGLPSNSNVSLGIDSSIVGIIYAPQARVALGGKGNNGFDFVGAIVARSVRLDKGVAFHYDEALRDVLFPK